MGTSNMRHHHIDFQGTWPEMLRAEVENIIQQYDPLADGVPADEASADEALSDGASSETAHRVAKDRAPVKNSIKGSGRKNGSAPKRFSGATRWIAQCNSAPTGPLYAIGRPGEEGQNRMGPVLATSGEELLDKLRALLSAADAPKAATPKEDRKT